VPEVFLGPRHRRGKSIRRARTSEKAFLAGWEPSQCSGRIPGRPDAEDSLRELRELAVGAGASIVGSLLQRSPQPDPATLLGRGKVNELRSSAQAASADLVIFDHDLTPSQLRNLERELDLRVIDRTQLILDIFAGHARSREGQLQVELAQLTYLLPRLGGHGTELSRLGGGIGTRGPGEQQLEYDRRRLRVRIRSLRAAIDKVRSQRALHRARRRDQQFLTAALVGYTNAGKSTLFNALTSSSVTTSSRLFATLDPTVRALPVESRRRVLLSDTVGFIQKLPSHLVAAFRATLEELEDASLLLHVTDASDSRHEFQDDAVESLLETLCVGATPRLHLWNKIDLVDPTGRKRFPAGPQDVWVSARTGEGLDVLLRRIDQSLTQDPVVEADFELSPTDGESLALLHRSGVVLSTQYEDDRVIVRARVRESLWERLKTTEEKMGLDP
jgi:GTP-binding protein HflX